LFFFSGREDSSEVSSFSTDLDVQIVSKTFITQSEIKALQMTTSLQGITSKDVISGCTADALAHTHIHKLMRGPPAGVVPTQ
jgi:hypothetical protein